MSVVEFDDIDDSETNQGFYDTLKKYANKSENDKLDREAKEAAFKDKEVKKSK